MQYVNIPLSVLRSVEYIGSDPVERSTFISLLGWCAEHETGGRIEGAAKWKDRQWQQLCAVTEQEVRLDCGLWCWEGDDIVLFWYPEFQEAKVIAARTNGKKGGRPKTEKKPSENQQQNPTPNPERNEKGIGIGKGIGKEREGEISAREEIDFSDSSTVWDETAQSLLDETVVAWNAIPHVAKFKPLQIPEIIRFEFGKRLVEHGPEGIRKAVANMAESEFYRTKAKTPPGFKWFLEAGHFQNCLDGKYSGVHDRASPKKNQQTSVDLKSKKYRKGAFG